MPDVLTFSWIMALLSIPKDFGFAPRRNARIPKTLNLESPVNGPGMDGRESALRLVLVVAGAKVIVADPVDLREVTMLVW